MFLFWQSKAPKSATTIKLSIEGMHCTSCAMSIDDAIEEISGVFSSETNFAKSITTVKLDPTQVTTVSIQNMIKKLGYTAEVI